MAANPQQQKPPQQQSRAIVDKDKQLATIKSLLDSPKMKNAIASVIPNTLETRRAVGLFYSLISTDPKLLACTQRSLVVAFLRATQLGLDFDKQLGQAYIVPFKEHGVPQATFIPGYKGLVKLARNSGEVKNVHAHIVYMKEVEQGRFDYEEGDHPHVTHKPLLFGDKGEPVGAYAVAVMTDDSTLALYMPKEDILEIKKRSKAKDDGPWVTDPMEMWKKTVVRRLCKQLPADANLERAVALDEKADSVDTPDDQTIIDVNGEVVPIPEDEEEQPPSAEESPAPEDKSQTVTGEAATTKAEAPKETPADEKAAADEERKKWLGKIAEEIDRLKMNDARFNSLLDRLNIKTRDFAQMSLIHLQLIHKTLAGMPQ